MAKPVYLEDNPPARTQFRRTRRAEVTGAIVVHTAENTTDTFLPDGGAEAVARFISTRTDAAGSYHTVVDSDSIVNVGRYEWEMFHEGTGGNRWSLGLSFACQAAHWSNLPDTWVAGAIQNGAMEARVMANWVLETKRITVPAKRITPAEYRAGKPGFIGHGDLDPGRRSDPGDRFPWTTFLDDFARFTGQEPTPMPPDPEVLAWQQYLIANQGADLGTTGDQNDGADGEFGQITLSRGIAHMDAERGAKLDAQERLATALDELEGARRELGLANTRIANVEAERDEAQEQLSDLLLGAGEDNDKDTAALIEVGRHFTAAIAGARRVEDQ